MIRGIWYSILDWFSDARERRNLIIDFNTASKKAFVLGAAPTLLEAKISVGNSRFRHDFSKFLSGGFRVKAMAGRELNRNEMIEIGDVILSNEVLVRQLISLGWDTLEVHASTGNLGLMWELKKFANIGGLLPCGK